jgi:hypothetical protein
MAMAMAKINRILRHIHAAIMTVIPCLTKYRSVETLGKSARTEVGVGESFFNDSDDSETHAEIYRTCHVLHAASRVTPCSEYQTTCRCG